MATRDLGKKKRIQKCTMAANSSLLGSVRNLLSVWIALRDLEDSVLVDINVSELMFPIQAPATPHIQGAFGKLPSIVWPEFTSARSLCPFAIRSMWLRLYAANFLGCQKTRISKKGGFT